MTPRDLLEWIQSLTEEELDLPIYAGRKDDGSYDEVNKVAICKTQDPDEPKAVFLDTLTDEEYAEFVKEHEVEKPDSDTDTVDETEKNKAFWDDRPPVATATSEELNDALEDNIKAKWAEHPNLYGGGGGGEEA